MDKPCRLNTVAEVSLGNGVAKIMRQDRRRNFGKCKRELIVKKIDVKRAVWQTASQWIKNLANTVMLG